jgi:hypothetical protein
MSGARDREESKMDGALRGSLSRRLVGVVTLLMALGCWLIPATASNAAEPAPAWSVEVSSFPTNLEPGPLKAGEQIPGYDLVARNVGGEATSGETIITDTFPTGIIPTTLPFYSGGVTAHPGRTVYFSPRIECEVAGQTVTCHTRTPIPSGEFIFVEIPIEVAPGVSGTVEDTAEVEGGGAIAAPNTITTSVEGGVPAFDFLPGEAGLSSRLSAADGSEITQAGGVPANLLVNLHFPTIPARILGESVRVPHGGVKNISVNLPKGVVVNPEATPKKCSEVQLEHQNCPLESQVGTITVKTALGGKPSYSMDPLFNIEAPNGLPAVLGFEVIEGVWVHLLGHVRSDGDYGLTANINTIPAIIGFLGATTELWGVPSEDSHDEFRGECLHGGEFASCPVERTAERFLVTPTSCEGALTTTAQVTSWNEPAEVHPRSVSATGMNGCNALSFEPTLESRGTTNVADSPSGLNFSLHVPQAPTLEQTVGHTNRCGSGKWNQSELRKSFTYQWLLDGAPIAGATSRIYVTKGSDAGGLLQCVAAAIGEEEFFGEVEASGPSYAASLPVRVLPAPGATPPSSVKPTLSVTGSSGSNTTLSCEPGAWGGSPTFSYRWYLNSTLLPAETGSTYELESTGTPTDVQCEAIGSNAAGSVAAYSNNQPGSPGPYPPYLEAMILPDVHFAEAQQPPATANFKNVKVTLPQGLILNPSAANGLGSCDNTQVGLLTPVGQTPIHFDEAVGGCPSASKIGTVEVDTPLLEDPLVGAAYLAKPFDNPFGSLLAMYVMVEDEKTGIVAKLPGLVEADATTGQLTATFDESPELPIEDVHLSLFNGARASLKTSLDCGEQRTTSVVTPWTTPEGADATPSDSFQTTTAPQGGSCAPSEAQAPTTTSFTAGTLSPTAGAYTPFSLRITRADGTQRITGIDTTLPPGLLGKLAGIPYCPDSEIAAAGAMTNALEGAKQEASPSCSSASEVGTVAIGAGAGPTPIHVSGHVYLAGPYKGAPISLVVITPAVAGPFDLGVVTTRVALFVDPTSAQIHAVSDPLPTILHGIPLDIRSIDLQLQRPSFTVNPTSCDPFSIMGSALTAAGSSSPLQSRFQVGGCSGLGFKPTLALSLKGGTTRAKNPALTAVLTQPVGQANIGSVSVVLPKSEFIDNRHINNPCTRVQYAANACPANSILGRARAYSPLLDQPLEGPVYFRSNGGERKLPDIVADLNGQVHLDVVGFIDSVKQKGIEGSRVRNTFATVPDAAVTKFVLELDGGKKGLLQNSANLCKVKNVATVDMTGQNGKTANGNVNVGVKCKKPKKAKKHHKKARKHHKKGKHQGKGSKQADKRGK